MEAKLTEMDSRTDNLEVSEDANVDEAISNINTDDTTSVRRTLQTNQQRVRISAKYFVIFLYDIISVITYGLICHLLFFAQYLL